jgi:hypothetical protein
MLTPEQNDAIFGPSIRVFRLKSGRVTIQEVYGEEKNLIGTVMAGKGLYAPIGQAWKIQSKLVAGDKGQTNAVYHVLRSGDLLTGIEGKPGTGKTTMICEAAAIHELTGQDPVMLAPTASAVQTLEEAGYTADTVANFQDKNLVSRCGARPRYLVR